MKLSTLLDYTKRKAYVLRKKWQPFSLPADEICLNYGGVLDHHPNGIITGGRVKLIHLEKLFQENENSFNILYLVSSALPKYAEELVTWCKGHGVKLVWNQNGVGYIGWSGRNTERVNRPLRSLMHQADFVFYQSLFCKKSADLYLGKITAPWEICYNYVDTDFFTLPQDKPSLETWKLVSAGTHLMWPGRVMSALNTIAILKRRGYKVRFLLAGRLQWENAKKEVTETIDRLSIREVVDIYSEYSQAEANKIYQGSHILLHPKYNDPCPTVPIEAMACGVPVVGSNSGGTPELIGKEGGCLVEVPQSWERYYSPDPEKMVDAVVKIMSDWDEYSKNARRRASALFNKEAWIETHEEVFRKVLESG